MNVPFPATAILAAYVRPASPAKYNVLLPCWRRAYQSAGGSGELPMPSRQLTLTLAECSTSLSGLAALLVDPLGGKQEAQPGAALGERQHAARGALERGFAVA